MIEAFAAFKQNASEFVDALSKGRLPDCDALLATSLDVLRSAPGTTEASWNPN